MMHPQSAWMAGTLRKDTRAFQAIYVTAFVVFLAVALIAQFLTLQWRSWLPGSESEQSLVDGVRSAVYTFMSYIP